MTSEHAIHNMAIAALILSVICTLLCLFVFTAWGLGINPPWDLFSDLKHNRAPSLHHSVRIPRMIHFIHEESLTTQQKARISLWQARNPLHHIKMWHRNMCDQLVSHAFPEWKNTWNDVTFDSKMRAQLMRCFIIAHEGGWFLEDSLLCDTVLSLDLYKKEELVLFKRKQEPLQAYNSLFGAIPHHPFFAELLQDMSTRVTGFIQTGCTDEYALSKDVVNDLVGTHAWSEVMGRPSWSKYLHTLHVA